MTDGEKMVWAAAFVKALDYSRATTPESAATAREIAMSYADGIVSMLRFTSYAGLSETTREALGYTWRGRT